MRGIALVLSFALLVGVIDPCLAGEPKANEALAVAMIGAINDRDLDALDELVAADVRRHSASTPGVVVENREQFKAFLRQDFATVPDSHQEIDVLFATEQFVGARVIYRGTQKGAWGPFRATDRKLEIPFIGILRVENGKIAEIWAEWDNLNALLQLGLITLPDAGAERPADSEAKLLSGEQPAYPPVALRARIQGDVVLEITISDEGKVSDVKVLRALPMGLTEAAVDQVKTWTFEPARSGGKAVSEMKEIRIPFRLPKE